MPTFFKRRGYHRGPSKSSRARVQRDPMLGLRKQPLPCPFIPRQSNASHEKTPASRWFSLVLAHRKKVEKMGVNSKCGDAHVGGCRSVVCLETGFLSISFPLTRDAPCICVCSTACGRPRLASGLYRDYICKTIRLNHFLNKRTWPPLYPSSRDRRSGSDRRTIPAHSRRWTEKRVRERGSDSNPRGWNIP